MCRSGCPTQNHDSYAACCRNSGIRVAYCNSTNGWDASRQKTFDNENAAYRAAVDEGIQPNAPTFTEIDKARRKADKTGGVSSVSALGDLL